MIRPCSGLDSKKSWQGGDNDEEHARSHRLGFDNCAFAAQRRGFATHSPPKRTSEPSTRAKVLDNASSLSASRSRRRLAAADDNSQVQGYGPTRSIPRA